MTKHDAGRHVEQKATLARVPRPEAHLTPGQLRELKRRLAKLDDAERRLDEERLRFAKWVRNQAGLSATARALGDIEGKTLSRSALDQRLRTAEGRRGSKKRRR